jgi:hypothetical protein
MKTRKLVAVSFALCSLLLVGMVEGQAFVDAEVAKVAAAYPGAVPCDKLDGFAGLLQQVGMIPAGGCDTSKGQCPNGRACEVANPSAGGPPRKGKCGSVPGKKGGGDTCVCEVK